MRETFLDFADNLIRQENAEEIFTKLSKILAENMLFHEEGACWEKILHINQNYELYRKIGDIFINKVGNSLVAFNAYNKYLQYTDPIFYNNYMNVAKKQGLSGFDADTEEFSVGMKLYDVFDAIVYMIICLLKNKDYEGVVQLEKKLVIADNNIKQYLSANSDKQDDDLIQENAACRKHLSQILSETPHHNYINTLAIKYDNQNKQAYVNIIGDYITYKNNEAAIDFYNNTYCTAFSSPKNFNIVDICWEISDYYRDKYDFYNSVLFQKYALELELNEVR